MKKVCLFLFCFSCFANAQQPQFWDGKSEMFYGISLGNSVWWRAKEDPNLGQNSPTDYARMREIGFNTVRFYLNYKFFESDAAPYQYKQAGWDFLNQNLEWAKASGIKLILNMHVPQGGFQSNAEGGALWEVEENQKRLIALWREIAKRYVNEPAIIAYDILNEPVVSKDKSQWQALAQKIVNAIREVDTNHFIFVERINGILPNNYSSDAEMNFVFINDPANKWGLTFHFYSPISYTHQYASWIPGFKNTDGGKYPDSTVPQFDGEVWKGATFENPTAPKGDSDWAFYTGVWKTVTDISGGNIGRPALEFSHLGEGTVWFDHLVFEKKSPDGVVSTIATYQFPRGAGAWYFWTEKPGGRIIENENAIGFTGTVSAANYGCNAFTVLEQGWSYRVSGRMKGENIPEAAACRVRFDWNLAKNIRTRDKAALEQEVLSYLNIAQAKNLPVYLGEFGVIKHALTEEKGGAVWVRDMIEILKAHRVPFTYHVWETDDVFGVKGNAGLEAAIKAVLKP